MQGMSVSEFCSAVDGLETLLLGSGLEGGVVVEAALGEEIAVVELGREEMVMEPLDS